MTTYDEYGVPVGAYSEPESLSHQALRLVRAFYLYRVRPALEHRFTRLRRGEWSLRSLGALTLVKVLVLLWWVVLYWGERGAFNGALGACDWESWEKWVCEAYDVYFTNWTTDTLLGTRRKSTSTHLRR